MHPADWGKSQNWSPLQIQVPYVGLCPICCWGRLPRPHFLPICGQTSALPAVLLFLIVAPLAIVPVELQKPPSVTEAQSGEFLLFVFN